MAKITIVEAAKQFNVTRPRIYRAIKKGELTATVSDDGVQLVQIQDMVRLFDNIKKKPVQKNVRDTSFDTDLKMIKILEEQLRKAEEDKTFLKQQIQDIRKDFEDYKLRIEHQEQTDKSVSVTSNDQQNEDESLQVEHAINMTIESPIFQQKIQPNEEPKKKGLLHRLVGEIFK
jgi:excisionase family DNA binding protein